MKIEYGKTSKEPTRYFDINGNEIHAGDYVMMNGRKEKVYLTENNELGIDATNPTWIERGKASPCDYGIYPFVSDDMPVLIKSEV